MKKTILTAAAMLFLSVGAWAQKTMVVDSEKVFKSIAGYNTAITQLDELAKTYQTKVDEAYDQLETMFNNYQSRKATMSAAQRQETEQKILKNEQDVQKYQEETFGENGTLMKKRIEMLKPYQDKVFKAIGDYAAANGYDIVLDIAANPAVLYYNPACDMTQKIIEFVKK